MSRWPRMAVSGIAVHAIQRGNNRQPIFYSPEDYSRFLTDLAISAGTYGCAIHAYVLMTNHVHLLLTPSSPSAVSQTMQALGRRYVRYINVTYRRSGTLWEGRFRSSPVGTNSYLLACSRYIELNPVRANMVTAPDAYRWSSYPANAEGRLDPLITPQPAYLALVATPASRCEIYRRMFREQLSTDTLRQFRDCTEAGEVIGDNRFRAEIENILKRRVEHDRHGGDRRSPKYKQQRQDQGL